MAFTKSIFTSLALLTVTQALVIPPIGGFNITLPTVAAVPETPEVPALPELPVPELPVDVPSVGERSALLSTPELPDLPGLPVDGSSAKEGSELPSAPEVPTLDLKKIAEGVELPPVVDVAGTLKEVTGEMEKRSPVESVGEPDVAAPDVAEPETAAPEVPEPEAAEPMVAEPEVAEPEVTEPELPEPETPELPELPKITVPKGAEVEVEVTRRR